MKKVLNTTLVYMAALGLTACVGSNGGNASGPTVVDNEYHFVEREIQTVGQTFKGTDVVYPDELWAVPEYEYADDLNFTNEEADSDGVRGLFYTSPIKYNGKKTKIAAYIGFPEGASAEHKVPAIVLVHGGLGTAIPDWVKYWNNQGFAAISIDTEGAEPVEGVSNTKNLHNARNRYAGSKEFEAGPVNGGFSDWNAPLEEQWMYHATSATILAASLISSFDCVDVQRLGITGISWGGVITSIVIGYDDRFSFAMPVYGALAMSDSCSGFSTIFPDKIAADRWDTTEGLKQTDCKVFYVNGIEDPAFSMDTSNKCAKDACGFVLFKNDFPHGQAQGALEENLPHFAKYFCGMESEYVEVMMHPTRENPTISFRTYGDVKIESMKLYYSSSVSLNKTAVWESENIRVVDGATEYSVIVPKSTYAYIQIKYNDGLEVSSYLF